MANLLQEGSAWLGEQMHAHAASEVTYRRGGQSVSLLATVGRTPFETDDSEGAKISYELRDYLVQAADLVLGGVQVEPERGDEIDQVIGGATLTYQVMPPVTISSGGVGQKEDCFRYSDEFRKTLRIHTKLVSA